MAMTVLAASERKVPLVYEFAVRYNKMAEDGPGIVHDPAERKWYRGWAINKRCEQKGEIRIELKYLKNHCVDLWSDRVMGVNQAVKLMTNRDLENNTSRAKRDLEEQHTDNDEPKWLEAQTNKWYQ